MARLCVSELDLDSVAAHRDNSILSMKSLCVMHGPVSGLKAKLARVSSHVSIQGDFEQTFKMLQ